MELYKILFLSIYNLANSISESNATKCRNDIRLVNAKYIFEESLNTRVGITNGEPFLNDFLGHPRFVVQAEGHCVNECLRYEVILKN